jgi:uncharacterized protein (TIGR00255 family)
LPWYSMTGYGQGLHTDPQGAHWRVELRAVNSKSLELRTNLPPGLAALDLPLSRWARQHMARGRVDLRVDFTPASAPLHFDLPRAQALYQQLLTLSASLSLPPPALADLLRLSQLWSTPAHDPDPGADPAEVAWVQLQPALSQALERFQATRALEGASLQALAQQHLDAVRDLLASARVLAPDRVETFRARLTERLSSVLLDPPIDPSRLAAEVALMADRLDVTEELDRAAAHCDALSSMISHPPSDGILGKRIDFLLQELTREANTLTSKSRDASLTQIAINLKNAIETMREQAANLQ